MLSNCGVGVDSWESLGQQGDQSSHTHMADSCECMAKTTTLL